MKIGIQNILGLLTLFSCLLPTSAFAAGGLSNLSPKAPISILQLDELNLNLLTQDQGPANGEWRPTSLVTYKHHDGDEVYTRLFSPYGLNIRLRASVDQVFEVRAGTQMTVTIRDANEEVVAGPRNCVALEDDVLCSIDVELAHKVGPNPVLYFLEGQYYVDFNVSGQSSLLRHVVDFQHQ